MCIHSREATPGLGRSPLWAVAAALALVLLLLSVAWAGAASATLGGVLAEGDGSGVRIAVLLWGPFHYLVTARADRIVITLDGVRSDKMTYRLAVGPVTGVLIRPRRSRVPRVDVVVTTRTPLAVVGEFLDDHALILRLAPQHAVAHSPSPTPEHPRVSEDAAQKLRAKPDESAAARCGDPAVESSRQMSSPP